jgi:hypothetical protein
MDPKQRVSGLVLAVTIFVMVAGPSTAQAGFTSNQEHTILSGSQSGSLAFSAGAGFGAITCSSVTLSGTTAAKSQEKFSVDPTFSECKDSFGRTVHAYELCPFLLETSLLVPGSTEVVAAGCAFAFFWSFVVTSGGEAVCTVEIGAQTDNGTSAKNLGGTNGIEVTLNSTNVVSTTSGGFFNCGIANGEHKSGTFKGATKITGKGTEEAAAEISVD